MSKLTRTAALAARLRRSSFPPPAAPRNKTKGDTAYVARDVNTLYALAKRQHGPGRL